MARSLGLSRVPTLDPVGDERFPSKEYVMNLVRALNANFEILNSSYGISRQDTTDLGSVWRSTATAVSVGTSFTQITNFILPPGLHVVFAKANTFDSLGGARTRTFRLRNFTDSVTLDTAAVTQDAVNCRVPVSLMGVCSGANDQDIRFEGMTSTAGGIHTVDNAVLWAYKIQELL